MTASHPETLDRGRVEAIVEAAAQLLDRRAPDVAETLRSSRLSRQEVARRYDEARRHPTFSTLTPAQVDSAVATRLTLTWLEAAIARAKKEQHKKPRYRRAKQPPGGGPLETKRAHQTGTLTSVYRAEDFDGDVEAGPWVVACEEHGGYAHSPSWAAAQKTRAYPRDWCKCCRVEGCGSSKCPYCADPSAPPPPSQREGETEF